ncbi:MAG: PocR ligand-binding domain-containing protein [Treponemataceae bacterium]
MADADRSVPNTGSIIAQHLGASGTGKNNKQDFVTTLTAVPVAIAVLYDRTIVEINDWFLSMIGYTREELLGKKTRVLYSTEEEYEHSGKDFYSRMAESGFAEIESRYRRKDGTSIDVLIRGTWSQPSNHDQGIIFVALNISDQKRTERALESRVLALTRPAEQADIPLRFEDLFDIREMQRIQDAFADATGVASIITAPDGTPITKASNFCRLCSDVIRQTEKGRLNCMKSDSVIGAMSTGGPTLRPCLSGGLWDGGAGIMVGDTQIANWLIGQVRDDSIDVETVRLYAREIGADQTEFDSALAEVPLMSKERFEKACNALSLIARQISFLAYNNVQQARSIAERKRTENELRESAARLSSALEEKEALYKELKHRVKNSLALMAGLVGLEGAHSEDESVRSVLDNMRTRIESFGVLYELLGGEGNPNAVRIDTYLERIVNAISDSFVLDERIDFALTLEKLSVPARIAAPIGLVIMELVVNSLKYAFPQNRRGTVSVNMKQNVDGSLLCEVSDDGVGFPAGFDPKLDGGLGIELIGMLIGQLKGIWHFAEGIGTRAVITVPLEPVANKSI